MAIWKEMPQASVTKINLKIAYLNFHSNFPGANELIVFLSGFAEQMEEDSVVFQHSSSTEDSTDTRNDESSRLVQPRQFLRQHSSPGSLSTTDESDAQESSSLDRALVLAQPCTAAVHQFRPPVIEPVVS